MMTSFKKLGLKALPLIALLVVSASARPAQALLNPSIVGGLSEVTNSGGGAGYTAGLRLGVDLGLLEVDLSGMWLSRGFTGVNNVNWIDIPLMLRYSLIPWLSIGAGFYEDVAVTSGASSEYGIRGSAQVAPTGIPLFVEANYDYSLGSGGTGNLNDFQLLVGFKF